MAGTDPLRGFPELAPAMSKLKTRFPMPRIASSYERDPTKRERRRELRKQIGSCRCGTGRS